MFNKTQISRRLHPVILLCLVAAFLLISFISQPAYPTRANVLQMPYATPLPSCSSGGFQCGNNIYPIADAYTDRTYPDARFGTQNLLYVSSDARLLPVYQSFLKFDLGTIPAGRTFVGATLSMCGKLLSGSTVYVYLFDVSTGWSESTITWSNQPAMGTQVATSTIAAGSQAAQGYYCSSWDVSSYVYQKLWARTPIVALGVKSGYGSLYYISREYPYTIPVPGFAVGNPVIKTAWR